MTLALTGVILALTSMGCTSRDVGDKPAAVAYPSSVAYNTVTVFMTGPTVTTRVFSERVVHHADKDSALAWGVTVDFFDNAGEHTSKMTADSALVREQAERLDVFGDVHVVTDDGVTLDAPHLAWNPETREIATDSLVIVEKKGEMMQRGYGFRSNPDLTVFSFKRRVAGTLENAERMMDSL